MTDDTEQLSMNIPQQTDILGDGTEKYQRIVQILKDGGANLQIPRSQ